MTRRFLILPGYGDSGPMHWQSLWQAGNPASRRVVQKDWEHPVREEWVLTLDRYVQEADGDVVLVAHSLAVLIVPHWIAMASPSALAKVKAAFMVAVPDPQGPEFPVSASGFDSTPFAPMPFPSLLAASSDDPYATLEYSRRCAQAWGSRFVDLGAIGHVNSQSGLGNWDHGLELLDSLLGIGQPG